MPRPSWQQSWALSWSRIVRKWHRCVPSACLCCPVGTGVLTWFHKGRWDPLASAWLEASCAGQRHAHERPRQLVLPPACW